MEHLAELTKRLDEAHAEREHAEAVLRAASTEAEHYAALVALQRAESARFRALDALTSAKAADEIDTWSRWCVHAHKDTTCDRESFMCIDAHSSEDAALEAVKSYWNKSPDRREDLFDYTEPAEPTIAVVVYELPPPDERSGTGPLEWEGTVTMRTPDDPDGDDASIRVDRK